MELVLAYRLVATARRRTLKFMAVNESRSMRTELELGATEGSYKDFSPSRGGLESVDTIEARAVLDPNHFDMQHTPLPARRLPTGRWAKHRDGRGGWTY